MKKFHQDELFFLPGENQGNASPASAEKSPWEQAEARMQAEALERERVHAVFLHENIAHGRQTLLVDCLHRLVVGRLEMAEVSLAGGEFGPILARSDAP